MTSIADSPFPPIISTLFIQGFLQPASTGPDGRRTSQTSKGALSAKPGVVGLLAQLQEKWQ
jgi:hypothetical protein